MSRPGSSWPISGTDQAAMEQRLGEYVKRASSTDFAERQDSLDEVLKILAAESFQEEPSKEYGNYFHELYSPCDGRSFRHQYASVYKVILDSASRYETTQAYEIAEALVNNLGIIKNTLIDDADAEAKTGLFSLIDHVNLEAQRLVRETAQDSRQTEALRQELRRMRFEMNEMQRKHGALTDEMAHQQRDYVTILSVFAAIIIAFGTGTGFAITLTGSVIPQGSVALICFVVSVIGLVLFNSLYALFEFLYRITRRGRYNMTAGPWGIMKKGTFVTVNACILAIALLFGILSYCNPVYATDAPEEALVTQQTRNLT